MFKIVGHIEIFGHLGSLEKISLGYQFLVIDCEHGAYSMETVEDIIRVARNVGIVPIVRVAEEAYHLIARSLDLGSQ